MLLALPLLMSALPSDRQQKIVLEADSATLNHQTGVTYLQGHVKLTQGTTELTGDTVQLFMDKLDHLQKAIAVGNLSKYQTQPEPGQPLFFAKAKNITYLPQEDQVILKYYAKATQGNNVFKGSQIVYHIQTQRIDTPRIGRSRTTIILFPKEIKNLQEQHKHVNSSRN